MKETTLNNSDAYRFLNIKALPILASVVEANGYKFVKPTTSAKPASKISDVVFKFRDAAKNLWQTSPTIYYEGSDSLAISLHKMMYGKNILFVKEGTVYVISTDKLLAIWSNTSICKIDKRSYQDGLGERAQLSRVNIEWLVANADMTFKMNEEQATKYNSQLAEIC